jgi:proprotein convertase subtilisin/kexin type 6
VSSDIRHGCTEGFTGTSAAAPSAAGLIALALEVQPCLSWRDVQHVVVNASTSAQIQQGEWTTNGAGRKVHPRLGFGWLQGEALLDAARRWQAPTPLQAQVSSGVIRANANLPGPNRPQELRAAVPDCILKGAELTAACVGVAEHVIVKFTLDAQRHGDISFTLVSPSGTRSELLGKRFNDANSGVTSWQLSSVHFWDETKVAGDWRLIVGNAGQGKATLETWELIVYGTLPRDVLHSAAGGAPVEAVEVRPGHHRPSHVTCRMCPKDAYVDAGGSCRACSPECDRGCFGPGVGGCVTEAAPVYNPPEDGIPKAQAAAAAMATLVLLVCVVFYIHRSYTRRQRGALVTPFHHAVGNDDGSWGVNGAFTLDSSSDEDDDEGIGGSSRVHNAAGECAAAPAMEDVRPLLPPGVRQVVL